MRVLITGGAGFVGAHLAVGFLDSAVAQEVVVLDNLSRRGAETNVEVLRGRGVSFVHGDVRNASDLWALRGCFDLLVAAAAEPSVHAGVTGSSAAYVVGTNLGGTANCLEYARSRAGGFILLSSSRVYAIAALRGLRLVETATRLTPEPEGQPPGFTCRGISETFPTVGAGARSLYGATKLASELLVEEYVESFGLNAVVNRCGVVAGPGQFGRADQGVFTLWVAAHVFGRKLTYTGFGGTGKQVRDLLHPDDLFDLIRKQAEALGEIRGETYGVGGGLAGSVSLREYESVCTEVTGRDVPLDSRPQTAPNDIPYYVTDGAKVEKALGWRPAKTPRNIVEDICRWLRQNEKQLCALFT